MNQKPMLLRYLAPPPRRDGYGERPFEAKDASLWERYSLPLGCGGLGACVFGYPDEERIQITENSFANPYLNMERYGTPARYGLTNFAELFIETGHKAFEDYSRELSLDEGVLRVSYLSEGVRYTRRIFASHPAQAVVARLDASRAGALSFRMRAVLPNLGDHLIVPEDGCGRTGYLTAEGDLIRMWGELAYYAIPYEGLWQVMETDGRVTATDGTVTVTDASFAVLGFVAGTSYRMESRVFAEDDPKKKLSPYPHPHGMLVKQLAEAKGTGFDRLFADHLADHTSLFSRVRLDLGGEMPTLPTDVLLADYREGKESRYLESLLYAYGRYLLIASSRRGGLPANLQGVWTVYPASPWSGGYWHNVNVQMNYWHACISGLSELFLAYSDYALAYLPAARRVADGYVAANYPDRLSPAGENGWLVRTGAWPYTLDKQTGIGHSGPGTGAFTSLLFWDYYDYTRDEGYLREVAYPLLREMSLFFTKVLVEKDGALLVGKSASPENVHNGSHYHTVGCAFDQQMVYENMRRTLDAAEILGIRDGFLDSLREILPRLSPVLVGADGQIKEYREEVHYGDIGEKEHRHISHLVGLYPGTIIHKGTPAWMAAAQYTLERRGDRSTGWALAHRLCLWARTGRGDRVMALVRAMLREKILPNLWDTHPPFQIDGNFGYTAGVSEALVGSSEGVVLLLPALPEEWSEVCFEGLVARGGFEISLTAVGGRIVSLGIKATTDGVLRLSADRIADGVRLSYGGKTLTPADGVYTVEMARGTRLLGEI